METMEITKTRISMSRPEYYKVATFLTELCSSGGANGLKLQEIAEAVSFATDIPFAAKQVSSMRDELGLEWLTKSQMCSSNNDARIDDLERKMSALQMRMQKLDEMLVKSHFINQ